MVRFCFSTHINFLLREWWLLCCLSGMGDRNVERLVKKYIDKRDDKLVDIVERCLRKGYDYEKMKDRVTDYVRDSTTRKRLIDALSEAFPQFARRRKHRVFHYFLHRTVSF